MEFSEEELQRMSESYQRRPPKQPSLPRRPTKQASTQPILDDIAQHPLALLLSQPHPLPLEPLDEYFSKQETHFALEARGKLTLEEYRGWLQGCEIHRVGEGGKLQEEGRHHAHHYLFVEGCLGAFRDRKCRDEEKESVECFEYDRGELILSNTLQTHKANPYTVRAKRPSVLLRFSEETFGRYLRKAQAKEFEELSNVLCQSVLLRGVGVGEMRRYLPYCRSHHYGYNEAVYLEGQMVREVYFILEGEAELSHSYGGKGGSPSHHTAPSGTNSSPVLYKTNYHNSDKRFKVVRLGRREVFGLESVDVYQPNHYSHHVRATTPLKVLAMGLDVLYDMENDHPLIEENIAAYLGKVGRLHSNMLQKHATLPSQPPTPKKRKKKGKKRRQKQSFEWWGLAQKGEVSKKKYRLPTPPHRCSSQPRMVRKGALELPQRISKLDYFRRRIFEDEMEELERLEREEKENQEEVVPPRLMPRLQKHRITMLKPRPKVVKNT